jgi:hypothetical protein
MFWCEENVVSELRTPNFLSMRASVMTLIEPCTWNQQQEQFTMKLKEKNEVTTLDSNKQTDALLIPFIVFTKLHRNPITGTLDDNGTIP